MLPAQSIDFANILLRQFQNYAMGSIRDVALYRKLSRELAIALAAFADVLATPVPKTTRNQGLAVMA